MGKLALDQVIIANLMAFRHVATKIYGFLIDTNKLNVVVQDINIHHSAIESLFQDVLDTLMPAASG